MEFIHKFKQTRVISRKLKIRKDDIVDNAVMHTMISRVMNIEQ